MGGLPLLRHDARPLCDARVDEGLAPSAAAEVATLALVWARRYGPARVTAAVAGGAVLWGWAVAQHPAPLPGELTVAEASAGRPTPVAPLP